MRSVGIDISAKTVTLVVRKDGSNGEVKEFENTFSGHKQLIQYLKPKKYHSRICLEATGTYHFDLAVRLFDTENLDVMVINPKVSKHFSETLSKPDKDDAVDAAVLAEYVDRMEFIPWQKPCDDFIKVRVYARRLAQLTQAKANTKNQLHASESSEEYGIKEVIKSLKDTIRFYEKEIAKLEKSVLEFIKQHDSLSKKFKLMLTIKGIAQTSAIQLLGELLILPKEMTNKQWVKYAGLNPRRHQSGTSVNKKSRISKTGNRHLRKALYMPALSATQHDAYIRGYYLHLIEDQGLKKIQALCAVMRKLLHAIHGMLENDEAFDNKRFYHQPSSKNVALELKPELVLAA